VNTAEHPPQVNKDSDRYTLPFGRFTDTGA